MPTTPTYPGVYIEEIPSGIRTITGVSTSVAAFIDSFKRGPMNKAIQIFSFADFEREFGGLDITSEASYTIQQFFLNGGTQAWVVRTASGNADTTPPLETASVDIRSDIGGGIALTVKAISPGEWGNYLRVSIDYKTLNPAELFNLTITEYSSDNPEVVSVRTEVFRNLTMDSGHPDYVQTVLNDKNTGSKLVEVTASGTSRPLQNGTLSGEIVTDDPPTFPVLTADNPAVKVFIGTNLPSDPQTIPVASFGSKPTSLPEARSALESAIRASNPANPAYARAIVEIFGNRLRILAGPGAASQIVQFIVADGDTTTMGELQLSSTLAKGNVQEYQLGGTSNTGLNTLIGAQDTRKRGGSGLPPNRAALIGDRSSKKGLFALEDVDLFNILCIPRTSVVSGPNSPLQAAEATEVITAAITYCEERRAMFIVDTPNNVNDIQEIQESLASLSKSRNAALYFPQVKIPDPLSGFRLRPVGASGTMAGVWSRTDIQRGVWKAPAGIEATLVNIQEIDTNLTDAQNGVLNPLGINCLRSFPVYGRIAWGARTLRGADVLADEYKYIPVRRLALFIEESLYRGLKWVVFEPNDEPLWSQIRLNVGAFMQNLFRQGAFQGRSPREAYLVKCDRETTTQNDINLGIVNIVVGFAPLKPAEFVILKIQQLAGQIAT